MELSMTKEQKEAVRNRALEVLLPIIKEQEIALDLLSQTLSENEEEDVRISKETTQFLADARELKSQLEGRRRLPMFANQIEIRFTLRDGRKKYFVF